MLVKVADVDVFALPLIGEAVDPKAGPREISKV